MIADKKPSRAGKIARRTFLVAAGVVGGGLLVGAGAIAVGLSSIDSYKLPASEGEASFGAWLKRQGRHGRSRHPASGTRHLCADRLACGRGFAIAAGS
jgi:hypothetical protein